jgi:hypothetical protein
MPDRSQERWRANLAGEATPGTPSRNSTLELLAASPESRERELPSGGALAGSMGRYSRYLRISWHASSDLERVSRLGCHGMRPLSA